MDKVSSADGTEIAYEAVGSGPTVILVGGAFCERGATAELAEALAGAFAAVSYDRRGRGDSGDTQPYDVRREIDDIEALISRFGERAVLYGISSGGALCLRAAAAGAPVDAVAVLEPPYRVTADAPQLPDDYAATLTELTTTDRRGEAVGYFMTTAVGLPPQAVDQMRGTPVFDALAAISPTLLYDAAAMGDSALPEQLLGALPVPVLAVHSRNSAPWLIAAAEAVAKAAPNGTSTGLDGGFHEVPTAVLAPVLTEFYRGAR